MGHLAAADGGDELHFNAFRLKQPFVPATSQGKLKMAPLISLTTFFICLFLHQSGD